MTKPAEIFSKFIHSTSVKTIPDNVYDAAKVIILDCIGAIVGGMAEPDMMAFAKKTALDNSGSNPILGTELLTNNTAASLINGTAGTVLEMDEGHQFAKGHPGMHIIPALLASLHGKDISGDEFIRAFILGYDVAARIGLASQLRPTMHPHGTWGGVGAAAALAAINKLSQKDTARLLNIASSLTLATSRKTMLEGGTVRNIYTGVSNQMAHIALQLMAAGFTGEDDGISSVFGSVSSVGFNHEMAVEDLGKRFELCRNYFKLHACCRYNHAALDALWLLMNKYPELKNINNIEAIAVESYSLAAELNDPLPNNVLASKFSVPYAMATTLIHQSSGVLSFTDAARAHPDIADLSARVSISEDLSMTAELPNLRPAKVTITMTDGAIFSQAVSTNRGDWQDPYNVTELKEKYISLTTRLWPVEKAKDVYSTVMTIEKHNMKHIMPLLTGC